MNDAVNEGTNVFSLLSELNTQLDNIIIKSHQKDEIINNQIKEIEELKKIINENDIIIDNLKKRKESSVLVLEEKIKNIKQVIDKQDSLIQELNTELEKKKEVKYTYTNQDLELKIKELSNRILALELNQTNPYSPSLPFVTY